MKRQDDGYTLVLVVVVLLVLSILSAGLLSTTLINLKNQRASVDRMAEKYVAQGELEKEIAKLEQQLKAASESSIKIDPVSSFEPGKYPGVTFPVEEEHYWIIAVTDWFADLPVEELTVGTKNPKTNEFSCLITRSVSTEKTEITAVLHICGLVEKVETDETTGNEIEFQVTFQEISYQAYQIGGAVE